MAHRAALTAARQTTTTTSTTSTGVLLHMLTNMEAANSIPLLQVATRLVTVARRVTTHLSPAGSKPFWRVRDLE
jgi:hypothetical protein